MTTFTKRRAPASFAALAILSLSGLGLAGCNNNKDPVAESQANMIESSADTVRAAGDTAANAIAGSGAETNNAMDAAGAATEQTTNALADSVRDAREAQAKEMDASADAVRKAGEKK
jgi:hypothetical protein